MRIYLAARYSRRVELCAYRDQLVLDGHTVTSRWLAGKHQLDSNGRPIGDDGESLIEGTGFSAEVAAAKMRERFAAVDLADVRACSVLVSFTESPTATYGRGGRHVEFGYALALRKKLIVVGHRENLFHFLPGVRFCPTWEDCVELLRAKKDLLSEI